MAGRPAKCKWCGKIIEDKIKATKKGNYWWHNSCLEEKEKQKNENKSDRQLLLDYINKLYEGQIPKYVYIQIEEFKKNYNMTYMGMLLTLEYAFNEKEMTFDNEKGVGIIPYLYDECSKEWKRQQEINKAIEEFEFEEKEVVVNKKINNKQWSKVKEINMEEEETIYG